MSQQQSNAYLKTKVLSAPPEQLRLMLIEGALRFARQGRDGLAEKNYEKSFENISKTKDIVLELINILRPDVDPQLCARLSSLYTYFFQRLTDANLQRDPAIVDEVIRLLDYERETWLMLIDKLKHERAGARPTDQTTGESAPDQPAAPTDQPNQVAGRIAPGPYAAPTPTSRLSVEG